MAAAVACAAMVGGAAGASQVSRSLERLLEEAALSGELRLSGRKLRELPRGVRDLADTVRADLSRNQLSALPDDLTGCCQLERLLLQHNTLRSLPDAVGALICLTYLDLRSNELSELPRGVCTLPLQVLLIADNRLEYLPHELGRLSALAELDAARNRLSSLPLSVGELRALRRLDLSANRLTLLPAPLAALRLEHLDLSRNSIASLPPELRRMTSLVTLRLEHNPLVSPPAAVCVRGRVHIFNYLEALENRDPRRRVVTTGPIASTPLPPLPPLQAGSGRSTPNTPNTPSTLSPGAGASMSPRTLSNAADSPPLGQRISPPSVDKQPLVTAGTQQSYREYKEALRQQRSQDVYRRTPDTSPLHSANSTLNGSTNSSLNSNSTVNSNNSINHTVNSSHSINISNAHNGTNGLNGHASPPVQNTPRRHQPPPLNPPTEESRRPVQKVPPSRSSRHVDAQQADRLSFTMKRELDKQREETELLHQLRTIIESRLKMTLPTALAPVLADGVVLCHLANHVRPRAVASVHVPSATQPKLTMARCRRNVDNFLEACRAIGVDEEDVCSADDIHSAETLAPLARTVVALLAHATPAAAPVAAPAAPRECRVTYARQFSDIAEADETVARVHPVPRPHSLSLKRPMSAPPPPPTPPPPPPGDPLVTTLCLGGFLLALVTLTLFPL